jgi:hypothetical protein
MVSALLPLEQHLTHLQTMTTTRSLLPGEAPCQTCRSKKGVLRERDGRDLLLTGREGRHLRCSPASSDELGPAALVGGLWGREERRLRPGSLGQPCGSLARWEGRRQRRRTVAVIVQATTVVGGGGAMGRGGEEGAAGAWIGEGSTHGDRTRGD